MATSSASPVIEEFDDSPAIEEFPDVPEASAPAIEEFPDVAEAAQNATLGALQAVDVMGAPSQLDWSDVVEARDQDIFRKAEAMRPEDKRVVFDGTESSVPETESEFLTRKQQLLSQVSPNSSVGRFLSEKQAAQQDLNQRAQRENSRRDDFGAYIDPSSKTPSSVLSGFMGPGLSATLGETMDAVGRNIGPAIGGALGAAAFIPGPTGVGARALLPIAGGLMGAQAGGYGQEAVLQSVETPEETQDRLERWAQAAQGNPGSNFAGAAMAGIPFFRPSLSQFARAAAGNRAAIVNLGAAAGIGAGTEVVASIVQGRPIETENVAAGALTNMLFNEPTRLGRALGFPGSPEHIAATALGEPRATETATESGGTIPSPERTAPESRSLPPEIPAAVDTSGNPAAPTSKVVEKVYHGTRSLQPFERRSPMVNGYYFTRESGVAEKYAKDWSRGKGDPRVIEAYINIENPAPWDVVQEWRNELGDGENLRNKLLGLGYDGIITPEEYVVFNRDQIRIIGGTSGESIVPSEGVSSIGRTTFKPGEAPIRQPLPEPSTQTPDAQQISETSTPDGGVRAPEVAQQNEPLPANESGEGVQPSGQGEPLAENSPETPREVTPVVEEVGRALPEPTGGEDATGIRNAIVDENRRLAGLPEREKPLARSFPLIHEEAKAALAKDPEMGRRLVSELAQEIRPLTDAEDAVLTFEQNAREQERAAAVDAVNNAKTPEEADSAQQRLAHADNALFEIYQVGQNAGTANARGLNARRLMQNRDFTLAKMLNEKRAIENNGEPLTREQTEEVTKAHARIAELEAKLAEVESKKATSEAQLEYRRMLRETATEAKSAAKARESQTDFLTRTREAAKKRIAARRGRLTVTVDPLNIAGLVDEAIVGATYVAEGVRDFAKWSAQMLSEFGERIKPQLQALFQKASALADDISGAYKAAVPETPEAALAKIKPGGKLEQKAVYDLYRAHVNAGITDFNAATERVTSDLKKSFPSITERQVMDALSGYGKTTTPSKEADLVKLREFRNLARLTAQLEDAQRGVAPLKTGPQRDKATAKVRELQKQVNSAIKKAGLKSTGPDRIATAHDARVNRLKNAIEETQLAIANRKRPERGPETPWTPEELALRQQLAEARERLDDVLGQPESDRLNAVLRSIERAQEKIRTGNIDPQTGRFGPETKEVSEALGRLKEANRTLAEMRKAKRLAENPPKTEDQKRLSALEKQRDALLDRISKGDIETKPGKATVPTKEQAELKAEIAGLNKQMAEMRKAARPQKPEDQATYNNLVKRLKAAEDRLAAGDLSSSATRKATVETQRVDETRAKLREVNRQIQELRSASDELRLERDKRTIQSQIRELQNKIAKGDYEEPAPRREPAMDREKIDLQYQLAKEKEKWQQGVIEAKRAKRPLGQKIWDSVKETANLSRAIVTSLDLPPVFRQGLFAIGRPIMTAKAVKDALLSIPSEKKAFAVQQEIENRPNAPLYQRAKLYLAKDTAQPLNRQEEAYMGNWFRKLPRWTVVGPALRASERSYNTFLNRIRADTFDAAVKAYSIADTDTPTLRRVADIINTMTGRSTLPGKLEQAAVGLNTFLFAPRFMASRFKVALGEPLWTGNAKTRTFALEQYGRTLAGAALIYGLAKSAGYEVESDPRSSNFGKIKIGSTMLDPLGGLTQVTTFLTRIITGETKTQKGKVVPLRESLRPLVAMGSPSAARGKPSRMTGDTSAVMGRFLRTKLNPVAGAVVNAATGTDLTGKPVTVASTAKNLAVPISFQDILDTMQSQGVPKGTALYILSLFGMGLQERK